MCSHREAPHNQVSRRHLCIEVGALLVPVGVFAQSRKLWRLAWLSPADGPGPNHAAFLARMKQLGYEEGKQFEIEWAWVGSNTATLPAHAARLVQSKPDLILTQSQICAQAAQKATSTIPIVFVGVRDAVAAGLVHSYASTGGNLTGVTLTPNDELVAKLLELQRELVPTARRLGVVWNPSVPVQASVVELLVLKGKGLGFDVRPMPVNRPGDLERSFAEMARERVEGVLTLVEWFTFNNRELLARLALQYRIPTMFEVKDYVTAGGLVSYGVVYHEHFASAAHYVDKILKGARPADLPVQQPAKLEMVVNRKTARTIGLLVPVTILVRADEFLD